MAEPVPTRILCSESDAGISQLGLGAEDGSWTRHAGHMLCVFQALFISLLAFRASLSCGSIFRWDVVELEDVQSDGGDNQDHGESSG